MVKLNETKKADTAPEIQGYVCDSFVKNLLLPDLSTVNRLVRKPGRYKSHHHAY